MERGCGNGALLAGCQAPPTYKSGESYVTVAKDPRRDTQRAREENEQAIKLMEQRKWSETEPVLKRALEADVTFGPAHNNLGKVYYQQSQLYLAAWEFQYAIKLMPTQAEPKNNLGLVLESAGKLDEAIEQFQQAVAMNPDMIEWIANSTRARWHRGDRDSGLRASLETIVLRDIRPEWVKWARAQLVLFPLPSTTTSSESP